MKIESAILLGEIENELKESNGRISEDFIETMNASCTAEYGKIGDSCRVCVLTMKTGHRLVGEALVLDSNNDVEELGNSAARKKAEAKMWELIGALAKLVM